MFELCGLALSVMTVLKYLAQLEKTKKQLDSQCVHLPYASAVSRGVGIYAKLR